MTPAMWGIFTILARIFPEVLNVVQSKKPEDSIKTIISEAQKIVGAQDPKIFEKNIQHQPALVLELHRTFQAMETLRIKDRQDARHRDLSMTQKYGVNRRADVMVLAAALGLLVALGTLIAHHHSLPGEAIGIISTIAGIFGSCLKDAYAFEFGSSRGSKTKDEQVAAALRHWGNSKHF